MNCISVNGKLQNAASPVFMVDNKGYRYGDGVFETMKFFKGKIILSQFHFERLFNSLAALKIQVPVLLTPEKLEKEIVQLCNKNKCTELARIRLSFCRGNGGLYDSNSAVQYLIECWPLQPQINALNQNGLVIGSYPHAKKSCDQFSNIKSANFLPYTMAALFAKENKWNDCLVLNEFGNIADSTIANVFIVKKDTVMTPHLNQGCINGVMRKYLIASLQNTPYKVLEQEITLADIENADEVFLTNAIYGIKWVRQFEDTIYVNDITHAIYQSHIKTFFI